MSIDAVKGRLGPFDGNVGGCLGSATSPPLDRSERQTSAISRDTRLMPPIGAQMALCCEVMAVCIVALARTLVCVLRVVS